MTLSLDSFWMKTRGMSVPRGNLSAHLAGGQFTSQSWDREYFQGCFLITNLAFWFDPAVQDYIQMVLKTGCDIEQRWQEQVMRTACAQISFIFMFLYFLTFRDYRICSACSFCVPKSCIISRALKSYTADKGMSSSSLWAVNFDGEVLFAEIDTCILRTIWINRISSSLSNYLF
jgi:hypothetical protein